MNRGNRGKKLKHAGLLLAAGAALAGGGAWACQGELSVARYRAALPPGLEGLDGAVIAQLSDLHSAPVGQALERALSRARPDLIVITGDLVNREDRDFSAALSLAALAAGLAPTCFAPGNHEADNPDYGRLRAGLLDAGVIVLEDQRVRLPLRGEWVNVMGLRDLTAHPLGRDYARKNLAQQVKLLVREKELNILLSHRPSLTEEYRESGADLIFSGHAHGGQVRLPLLGPVFAPDEGFFPRHAGGLYDLGRVRLVVSRGLGNGTPYPRLWNGPELVLLTLEKGWTSPPIL